MKEESVVKPDKISAEDRVSKVFDEKFTKIKSFNSQMYYICFMLLNILTLILAMVYLNHQEEIEDLSIVWQNVTAQTILLLFGIFVAIMILKTLPNFLKLYNRTKKRKFGLIYRATAVGEYYSIMTMYSSGEKPIFSKYLSSNGISEKHSIDIAYSKQIFNRIASMIYGFVILLLGFIFWMKKDLSLGLCLLAIIPLIYNLVIIITVICFNHNKKSTINFVANLCKFLYNRKIIKDYEKLYNKIIDNLLIFNKVFKQNKILIFTEISAYILVNFLKSILLYYSLISLNISGVVILGSIIFRYTIFESIIRMWPLQKGCLIFEFLFVTLFSRFFFSGYVFWGMIILRIFEYLIYIIQYVLVLAYDGIKYKIMKKSAK